MHVLFVCTGNIFRSLTAEYALRRSLPTTSRVTVSSAGTEDYPHVVKPVVRDFLLTKGIDVRGHHRRTLTPEMLAAADLVIAMSTEHRAELLHRFDRAAPLFTEACGMGEEPLPDVDEIIPDHLTNTVAVESHVRVIIDRILALTPLFVDRLLPMVR